MQLSKAEQDELKETRLDQTEICKLKYLPHLVRLNYQLPSQKRNYPVLEETFAHPAIFYPHAEETNFKRRLKQISQQKHSVSCPVRKDEYLEYLEEAQFLSLKPVSFFIIGKPGIGDTEVARLLSGRWKCINLNPYTVVQDEIKLGSRIGKCFEFTLKCGRIIHPDVIVRLLEKRVKSETAEHRGFVISGFPIIQEHDALQKPLVTEETMLEVLEALEVILPSEDILSEIAAKKLQLSVEKSKQLIFKDERINEEVEGEFEGEEIFGESPRKSVPIAVPEIDLGEDLEEEEVEDVLKEDSVDVLYERGKEEWTLADDIDVGDTSEVWIHETEEYLWDSGAQMEFLFKLFEYDFVIIYLKCENIDALNLRLNIPVARWKVESKRTVMFSTSTSMAFVEKRRDVASPLVASVPRETKSFVSMQLREYTNKALPVIQRHILQHKPDHFMKIDGRLPPTRIIEIVLSRLKVLAFPPIVVPQYLKLEKHEDPGRDNDSIENKTPENYFPIVRYKNVINPYYRLELSNWYYKCPVAAKYCKTKKGKYNLAVKYMNKVYFLSDDASLLKFYRNPHLYLHVTRQSPVNIWIMGPGRSGRTALARHLSHAFVGVLVNPDDVKKHYIRQEQAAHRDQISTKAIDSAIEMLMKNRLDEREMLIDNWKESVRALLKEALEYNNLEVPAVERPSSVTEDNSLRVSTVDNAQVCNRNAHINVVNVLRKSSNFLCPVRKSREEIQDALARLNLPSITETEVMYLLLKDEQKLLKYLPCTLTEPIQETDAFNPFVMAHVDDVLKLTPLPDVPISSELLATLIGRRIKKLIKTHERIYEGKPSVIADGMPPDIELLKTIDERCYPNYVICLQDSDPEHKFLINKLLNRNTSESKNMSRALSDVWKMSIEAFSRSMYRMSFIEMLAEQLTESSAGSNWSKSDISIQLELSKVYAKNIDKFNSDWALFAKFISEMLQDDPIIIDVTDKKSDEIIEEAMACIANKKMEMPIIVTEEYKTKEKEDFISSMRDIEAAVEVMGEGDEEKGEAEEPDKWQDLYLTSRKYGNTGVYCPVAYYKHSVLWKGKEEFSLQYKRRLYLLSSENAMRTFLQNPYSILEDNLPAAFPPTRVVIIGALGSGKTSVGKNLAKQFALSYLHFDSLLLEVLNIPNLKNIFDVLIVNDPEIEPKHLHMIKDYLVEDGNAAAHAISSILQLIWCKEPYINSGFVLDGFPRRKSDIQLMISNYFIPDIVLELHVTQNEVQDRVYPLLYEEWSTDLAEKQRVKKLENNETYARWKCDRDAYINYLMAQRREQRRVTAYELASRKKRIQTTPASSAVSLASEEEEYMEDEIFEDTFSYTEDDEYQDLYQVEEIVQRELPPPIFDDKWENEADAVERIRQQIDLNFTREISYLDEIRPEILKANIAYELIDTTGKLVGDVLKTLSKMVEKFKNREPTILESAQAISLPLAEQLLDQGYYYLSKFGRLCPVQAYENTNPIHMYLHSEEMLSIYAMSYRRYIYFLNGVENRNKFKANPSMYVISENYGMPLLPVRIAIIGPPKSGKSSLARRFRDTFGLSVITRGGAIRQFLIQFPNTELSKTMRYILGQGWCVTDEMVIRAVEALTMEGKSVSQGYVLDGFPNSVGEMKHMISRNIIPFVVLDLQADLEKIKERTAACMMDTPYAYSFGYIRTTYSYWCRNSEKFRTWLQREYENIYPIDTSKSRWLIWEQARQIVFSVYKNMHKYLKERNLNKPQVVNSFCITSQEFYGRESCFKNYCPCCLYNNKLYFRERDLDSRNTVLYGQFYYCVCTKHLREFLDAPYTYLPPLNSKKLPKHLPVIVDEIVPEKVMQDGFCLVTFSQSMPKHVLVKGDPNLAVRYRKKFYLFCSADCLNTFMVRPEQYFNIKVHFRKSSMLTFCDVNKLPITGYLQMFVADLLTKALVNTEMVRPFCPGLTVEQSALINIAFFLKRHNPNTRKEVLVLIEEGYEKFEQRRKIYKKVLSAFKSCRNPFLPTF